VNVTPAALGCTAAATAAGFAAAATIEAWAAASVAVVRLCEFRIRGP